MNWFERHLNWVWILAVAVTYVVAFIAGGVMGFVDPTTSDEVAEVLGYLIWILIMAPVSLWHLNRKDRSYWWILLCGWVFIPLILSNKRDNIPQLQDTPQTSLTD